MPTQYSEVTLETANRLLDMFKSNEDFIKACAEVDKLREQDPEGEYPNPPGMTMFYLDLLEALLGIDADTTGLIEIPELDKAMGTVSDILNVENMNIPFEGKHFEMNGKLYVMKTEQKFNTGELAMLEHIQQQLIGSPELLASISAVLIRPGYSEVNDESGKTKYYQDKYKASLLDDRVELFMKHLTVDKAIASLNFYKGSSRA